MSVLNRIRQTWKSQSGMTLVEVMIAGAVMMVIFLALGSMSNHMNELNLSTERRLEAIELNNYIVNILSNNSVCSSSLVGSAAPVVTASVPTLSFPPTSPTFMADDSTHNIFSNGDLKILSMKYASVAPMGALQAVTIRMQVSLQGNGTKNIVGGNLLKPVDFSLIVAVDPITNKITSCGSTDLSCTGTYPNIGCYRVYADGTIEEWGTTSAPSSGGTATTGHITYPKPFTTLPSLMVSAGGPPNPFHDTMMAYADAVTINGTDVYLRCAVNIGGSGCPSISNSVAVGWHAIGK